MLNANFGYQIQMTIDLTLEMLGSVDIQFSHTKAETKAMNEAKRWASFS